MSGLSTSRKIMAAVSVPLVLTLAACTTSTAQVGTPTGTSSPAANATSTPSGAQNNPTAIKGSSSQFPDITSVVNRVQPAIVAISVESLERDFFLRPVPVQGAGSGVIINSDGYIVTSNHVIQGAQTIRVVLPDGREFTGTLVGRDPLSDLAVIRITGTNLPSVPLLENADPLVGAWVIAIGNALDLEGGPTVTVGVVSAKGRSILSRNGVTLFKMLQTDAAINPGNSGGPLVDLNGNIVGINTSIISNAQGIGFSIAAPTAKPIVDELIKSGRIVRPQLGVTTQTVDSTVSQQLSLPAGTRGAVVTALQTGSPAARAGIQQGDVITKIGDKQVTSSPDLQFQIWSHKVGDNLPVSVLRNGQTMTLQVQLGERPPEPTAVP
ncbi:MAG: PDZ domain-containing protein [Dehalococcoidia bacterium]|nr:PDZ domain-containing protein [Dehalococcoidia bacterium]